MCYLILMSDPERLRVVTYNIHKCRGMDGRIRPMRIVDVLREINADIVALQEVFSLEGVPHDADQAQFISDNLDLHYGVGETRKLRGRTYGNVVLSRFPVRAMNNYDLTVRGCERRACLRADLELNEGKLLHIFNVHLGTAFLERRHQARKLVNGDILNAAGLPGLRIMLGDFNEWTRGLVSRLLASRLESANVRLHLRRSRTYPGLLPLLHLDHIYFDPLMKLESLSLHRSRRALIASDHLPLIADFRLPAYERSDE